MQLSSQTFLSHCSVKKCLVASYSLWISRTLRGFSRCRLSAVGAVGIMAAMLETYPRSEEETNLIACIFLQHLPREIRVLLAKADHKDLKTLATQADEL
jgi:hypothetical protein